LKVEADHKEPRKNEDEVEEGQESVEGPPKPQEEPQQQEGGPGPVMGEAADDQAAAAEEEEEEEEEDQQGDEQEGEQAGPEPDEEVEVVGFKIVGSVLRLDLAFDMMLQGCPPPLQIPLATIHSEVSIDDHAVMLRRVGGAALRLRFVVSGKTASKQVCKFKNGLHNYFRGEVVEGVEEAVEGLLYIWEDIGQVQIRWPDNYTTVQPLSDVEGEEWYERLEEEMRARRTLQIQTATLGSVTDDIMVFNR